MARFVFRLQSFLNLKEQLEKNVKNELGVANQKLQQEKIKLRRIKEDIDLTLTNSGLPAQVQSAGKIKELKI